MLTPNDSGINYLLRNKSSEKWDKKVIKVSGLVNYADFKEINGFTHIIDNRGMMMIFFSILDDTNTSQLFLINSTNYGKESRNLKKISDEFSSIKATARPIILEQGLQVGTLLLPIWDIITHRVALLISHDNGDTWNPSLYIEHNDEEQGDNQDYRENLEENEVPQNLDENSKNAFLMELDSNKIMLILKDPSENKLSIFKSEDVGYTWNRISSTLKEKWSLDFPYEIFKIKAHSPDNPLNNRIFVVGYRETGQDTAFPCIWQSKDLGNSFQEIWKDTSSLSRNNYKCKIHQDFSNNMHFLFQVEENKILHTWGPLNGI